ncbi:MAG: HpcH/HpaI aldolase/citrate lyase family protein [Verrucomicrobiota bacterium]
MRHNAHNPDFPFVSEPVTFDRNTAKDLLSYCLGATLYMPGTKAITEKIIGGSVPDLTSMVMCFEDAIAAESLPAAEANVLQHLETLDQALEEGRLAEADIPLTFLRVRNPGQFKSFAARLDHRHVSTLSGFVFPKFYSDNGHEYLGELERLNARLGAKLYGMPILEGNAIAYRESRVDELSKLRTLLQPFKELILNIRVGGTDFSSLFGVRRGMNSSIYDILPVRDCLSDILNYFNRAEDSYTVSAPVWEYFLADSQDDIGHLLEGDIHRSLLHRHPILNDAIDGLLREVVLDKANGFVGKTVIHPSHLRYVNAMQAVTREEYEDACQILETAGGVVKSARANKMNEINPHRAWAHRVRRRARAYGVIEDEGCFLKLMLQSSNQES